jgi:acyl-CoA reductase-like NAD-dependent aldehyde dehydrogenase
VIDKFTLQQATSVAVANASVILKAAELAHEAAPACRRMKPYVKKQILLAVANEVWRVV